MGSGKGASPPAVDNTEMDEAMSMMQLMSQMQMMNGMNMPSQPTATSIPEITTADAIDWSDKNDQLQMKMAADYQADQADKKGRSDTILTSPLDDDEDDTNVTQANLGGE